MNNIHYHEKLPFKILGYDVPNKVKQHSSKIDTI